MSLHNEGWAQLKHGGLLLSPAKVEEFSSAPPMSAFDTEKLRRAITSFDGSNESLAKLLDYVLEISLGYPPGNGKKHRVSMAAGPFAALPARKSNRAACGLGHRVKL